MIPHYSLDLFKLLLNQKPAGLPTSLLVEGEEEYNRLEREAQTPEQVEGAMIVFGKKAWPFVQAQNEFLQKYGEVKRREAFYSYLPETLQSKWKNFEAGGGNLHNFREGERYEEYFDAEEDIKIEKAMVEANRDAKQYVEILAKNEKKEEYDGLVNSFQVEQANIEQKIEELRELKRKGKKWIDEIDVEIDFFEKGFAEIEERPTVEKVQAKIDWYKGQIEGLE